MEGVRLVLRDGQWARIEPHLVGKAGDRGVTARRDFRYSSLGAKAGTVATSADGAGASRPGIEGPLRPGADI